MQCASASRLRPWVCMLLLLPTIAGTDLEGNPLEDVASDGLDLCKSCLCDAVGMAIDCQDVGVQDSVWEQLGEGIRRSLQIRQTIFLNFQNNHLSYVPEWLTLLAWRDEDGALSTMPLQTLNLNVNRLNLLLPNNFGGLGLLRTLQMQTNEIQVVPDDTFVGLAEVEELDLSNNHLGRDAQSAFSSGSFSGLTALVQLDSSFNELELISDSSFYPLKKCERLLLQSNYLQDISSYSFDGLDSLQLLKLHHNELQRLQWNMFKPLKKLRALYLYSNVLGELNFDAAPINQLFSDQYNLLHLFCDADAELDRILPVDYKGVTIVRLRMYFPEERSWYNISESRRLGYYTEQE